MFFFFWMISNPLQDFHGSQPCLISNKDRDRWMNLYSDVVNADPGDYKWP